MDRVTRPPPINEFEQFVLRESISHPRCRKTFVWPHAKPASYRLNNFSSIDDIVGGKLCTTSQLHDCQWNLVWKS